MIDSLDDGYVTLTATVVGIVIFSMVSLSVLGLSTRVETSSFQRSASDYRTELADQFLYGISDSEDCLRANTFLCGAFDLATFGTWTLNDGWCIGEDQTFEDTTPSHSSVARTVTYCVNGRYGTMQVKVADCYTTTADCATPPLGLPNATFDTVPKGLCALASTTVVPVSYQRSVTIDDGETVFTDDADRPDPCFTP